MLKPMSLTEFAGFSPGGLFGNKQRSFVCCSERVLISHKISQVIKMIKSVNITLLKCNMFCVASFAFCLLKQAHELLMEIFAVDHTFS